MNRSTNILGFSLLAVAATLAAMITMRNTPNEPGPAVGLQDTKPSGPLRALQQHAMAERSTDSQQGSGSSVTQRPRAMRLDRLGGESADVSPALANRLTSRSDSLSGSTGPGGNRLAVRDSLRVSLPEGWLSSLPADQRTDWQDRVASVNRSAGMQLAQLTERLELNSTQRRKLFPALVRAAPDYDPVMTVGGSTVAAEPAMTPAEEIHAALEPDQQAQVEDDDVNRQLWWQDIIERLEKDLEGATGDSPIENNIDDPGSSTSPADRPLPADDTRDAPAAREDRNLFDLIEQSR